MGAPNKVSVTGSCAAGFQQSPSVWWQKLATISRLHFPLQWTGNRFNPEEKRGGGGKGLLVIAYRSLKALVSLLPDLGLQQLILLSLTAVLESSFRNHTYFLWQLHFLIFENTFGVFTKAFLCC